MTRTPGQKRQDAFNERLRAIEHWPYAEREAFKAGMYAGVAVADACPPGKSSRPEAASPDYRLLDNLANAAQRFRDAFKYDPGHSDLDNEQPITITVTLGDWRRLNSCLPQPQPEEQEAKFCPHGLDTRLECGKCLDARSAAPHEGGSS